MDDRTLRTSSPIAPDALSTPYELRGRLEAYKQVFPDMVAALALRRRGYRDWRDATDGDDGRHYRDRRAS